jgi:hypothetical protein
MLECFGKKTEVGLVRERAVIFLQLGNDRPVIFRIDHYADMLMILGGGAHHAGPADIDILDDFLKGRAARDGGFEWIKVNDDQIYRRDPVLFHFC